MTYLGLVHDTTRVLVLVSGEGITGGLGPRFLRVGLASRGGGLKVSTVLSQKGRDTHVGLSSEHILALLEVGLLGVRLSGGGSLCVESARVRAESDLEEMLEARASHETRGLLNTDHERWWILSDPEASGSGCPETSGRYPEASGGARRKRGRMGDQ